MLAPVQPNGDKYEGEWVAGLKQGGGTQWVRRDGKLRKLYTGDWVAGKPHVRGPLCCDAFIYSLRVVLGVVCFHLPYCDCV